MLTIDTGFVRLDSIQHEDLETRGLQKDTNREKRGRETQNYEEDWTRISVILFAFASNMISMYGNSNILQLPITALLEFMVSRTWEACIAEFGTPKVALAGIQVQTGWKWKAEKYLELAESRLRQKVLLGLTVWALATSQRVDKARGRVATSNLEGCTGKSGEIRSQ